MEEDGRRVKTCSLSDLWRNSVLIRAETSRQDRGWGIHLEEEVNEIRDPNKEVGRRRSFGNKLHGDVRREPNGVLDVQTLRAQIMVISVDLSVAEDRGKRDTYSLEGSRPSCQSSVKTLCCESPVREVGPGTSQKGLFGQ